MADLDLRPLRAGDPLDDPLDPYRGADRRPAEGRAWVLANMVAGLDGSAAVQGRVGALSDPTDQALFRLLRSVADVVLVGAETVRREGYGPVVLPDDLRRARADLGRPPVPPLAVVTRSMRLDWAAPCFTGADPSARTVVVTADRADAGRVRAAGEVAEVVRAGDERVDLDRAVDDLARRFGPVVLCEGGPAVLGELVAADRLDELCLTLSPVLGGDPVPVASHPTAVDLRRFRLAHVLRSADLLYLRYERDGDR